MEPYSYDGVIVITATDLERVKPMLYRTKAHMPVKKLVFIGSEQVGELVKDLSEIDACFVNENDIIPFTEIENTLKKRLDTDTVPRGITGWYYQQFLKMAYSSICENEYYLVWDGDTIPCANFSMFKADTNIPYLDVKHEYNEEYFITMDKLFPGFHKIIGKSFISEHMLMNCNIMRNLINDIENNDNICGKTFYEKIINAVRKEKIKSNSFSEFETYGTYVALKHTDAYMLRDWHSLRFGGFFFKPEEMTDDDFIWLSQDFHAVSFEKEEDYIPEYGAFFNDPKYRNKLKPHHIVEAIWDQKAIVSNVVEKWD